MSNKRFIWALSNDCGSDNGSSLNLFGNNWGDGGSGSSMTSLSNDWGGGGNGSSMTRLSNESGSGGNGSSMSWLSNDWCNDGAKLKISCSSWKSLLTVELARS